VEDHRQLYNAALEHRRTAYRMRGVIIRYCQQSAELKDIRRGDPAGQGRWSFSSQQATLRRLDKAMAAFFRRLRDGGAPGYPRFKGSGWFDSVTWPSDGDGCRWYLILACDDVPSHPFPATGAAVGLDMGITNLVTTSDGEHIANPRHLAESANKIAQAQRDLIRKNRGSNRRRKARRRVATLHRKVRCQRLDHAHKVAVGLVRRYDLIVCEDLRIANMTRSSAGTVQVQGQRVGAKSGLNRAILDAAWGVFLSVLASKAESAGRVIVAVDPRNTSRTCPKCGHCVAANRVSQAGFRCVACSHAGHADVVGATNVLRAGLALQAAEAA